MSIVNTVKSIMGGQSAPDIEKMPDVDPGFNPGPDEIEEDEPDRVGNTDPGTNVPVGEPADEEDLFPADAKAVREAALARASAEIRAKALADAGAGLAPKQFDEHPSHRVKVLGLRYIDIGGTRGHLHISGVAANGQHFAEVYELPAALCAFDLAQHILRLSR